MGELRKQKGMAERKEKDLIVVDHGRGGGDGALTVLGEALGRALDESRSSRRAISACRLNETRRMERDIMTTEEARTRA